MFLSSGNGEPPGNGEPRQTHTDKDLVYRASRVHQGRSCVISVANTFLIAPVSWLLASLALIGQVPIS